MARTLALWVIAVCYMAQTFGYYSDESNGLVLTFGNYGYYFEGDL